MQHMPRGSRPGATATMIGTTHRVDTPAPRTVTQRALQEALREAVRPHTSLRAFLRSRLRVG